MATTYIGFDIETIREKNELADTSQQTQRAWEAHSLKRYPDENPADSYKKFASLFPEFSKICCISVKIKKQDPRSFCLDSSIPELEREKALLVDFAQFLTDFPQFVLVGHNIKKFDMPFINVRCVCNGLKVMPGFKMFGVKPWESRHIDTLEVWTGGVFGSSQSGSIESICNALGIESPKAEFSGAQVSEIYYSNEADAMERIAKYCERDVLATTLAFSIMAQFEMA